MTTNTFTCGTFFLESHPEDLFGYRERQMQKALRSIGLRNGLIVYHCMGDVAKLHLYGDYIGDYSFAKAAFI